MRTSRSIAARITTTYAAVASLWILVSSVLAFSLPQPLEGVAEIAKGLAFVAVTSFLLYLVVARWTRSAASEAHSAVEERRMLQRVVDTLPVGVIVLDGHGTVDFMNPAAAHLLDADVLQCVGLPLELLCESRTQGDSTCSVGELLATGCVEGLEIKSPDGGPPRTIIARAAELNESVPGRGWVIALSDYTRTQDERQRTVRLLSGYRFVSEMATLAGRVRDEAQLFGKLCELAVANAGFKAAWVIVRDETSGEYRQAAEIGLGAASARPADWLVSALATPGDPVSQKLAEGRIHVENALLASADTTWVETAMDAQVGSGALFGIVERGVIRVVVGLFAEETGFFGAEELRLVESLRNDVAFAIDRLTLDEHRSEAEEALEKSEEGYREAFECNPQPMWVYDVETLGFLAVNDAAVSRYGYSRDELRHMTIKDIRPQSAVAQLLEHLSRKGSGLHDGGYWTHQDASGREFPVHVMTHDMIWAGRAAELVMVQEVATVR